MRRALLIILDGAADRPVVELGRRTPLEAARKPVINRLASEGMCGIMHPIRPGVRPGSDTAHLALFGYDPYRYYTGRGPFEALGLGVELRPGDVAFRTNIGTVDENMIVRDRRAGRYFSESEVKEVEDVVNRACEQMSSKYGVEILYKHGVEHRGVLVVRGERLSHKVEGNDPHRTGLPVRKVRPLDKTVEAQRLSDILNELIDVVHKMLKESRLNRERARRGMPLANMLLIRGPGTLPDVEPVSKRFRIRAALVAGIPMIKGIGRALGFDVVEVPGYVGSKDDDFGRAFDEAVRLLSSHDLVVVHVKPTDSMGHDGDYAGKMRIIEAVDNALVSSLERAPENTYVIITCDHATPVVVRDHTGDPVPVTIWGPDVITDDVSNFSERHCSRGALGVIYGEHLMDIICNYLGVSEKFGE